MRPRVRGLAVTRLAREVALVCLLLGAGSLPGCGDSEATSDGGETGGPDAGVTVDAAEPPVPVTLRFINLCATAVDVYVGADEAVLLGNVVPGQVTQYLDEMLGGTRDVLRIRRAGDSAHAQPLGGSQPVHPAAGDRATVAFRGSPCSVTPLWEKFLPAGAGALRVRFVDALGQDTPTRLYSEQTGGLMQQLSAIDALGDSGPDGVPMPAAPAGSCSSYDRRGFIVGLCEREPGRGREEKNGGGEAERHSICAHLSLPSPSRYNTMAPRRQ